jgi:cysteine desulfurase/selenocysteine lyase
MPAYDVETIRKDFPVLERTVSGGKALVYLDNAATSQKPVAVLDAVRDYYERSNANVHRGVHTLGEEATALYEGARDLTASFINAADRSEVVFAKNATEGINLLAYAIGNAPAGSPLAVGPGDEILITEMEHHSNIVPWQLLTQRTGATLRWLGLTDDGRLDLADLDKLLNERTKIVSFVHQSNILGTINPVETVVRRARAVGALVFLDGSQSVPHHAVDVQALGVDALVFTGHKMLAPTGIGILWARRALLDELPPFLGGGEMISEVTMAGSTYADAPHKFEAGTPPIAEAVGLGAAIRYLTDVGMDAIADHEAALTSYTLDALRSVDQLRIIGPDTTEDRGGSISFVMKGIHPHDVGQLLDQYGVAVRVGHHCARPVCVRFGVPATTRASFALYTTTAEIDALVEGLGHVRTFFGR